MILTPYFIVKAFIFQTILCVTIDKKNQELKFEFRNVNTPSELYTTVAGSNLVPSRLFVIDINATSSINQQINAERKIN